MDDSRDVVVIGGGPAGLSAALNAVIRGASVLVLDQGMKGLAKAERIDNYLGLPGVSGEEIISRFAGHANSLGVKITKGKVGNILPMGNSFMVGFGSQILSAKAVVMAVGIQKARIIAGEEEYLGKGVSYCATCDGMLFRGKETVVYGLAADAPEEANYLAGLGVRLLYINPGPRPAGLKPEIPWREGKLKAVLGRTQVNAVALGEDAGETVPTEGVFILRDSIAPQALAAGAGLQMDQGYVAVNRAMQTNLPGLFACGDCTGPPLQIAKAVGEGLTAGQEAAKYAAAVIF